VTTAKDWQSWHQPYADADSPLSRRLRLVQRHIASWLDERRDEPLTVVSACAGQGHDLLGVLATRPDASRVRCTLLEDDERNVAVARSAFAGAALTNVKVVQADAGDLCSYVGSVPADLVLMAGVFGNISDGDVHRTIEALPQLCAPQATVIWTRSRRAPDLTPAVHRWLEAAGLVEQAFHAPQDVLFAVGVHRFAGAPRPLGPDGKLFEFLV
jgi:ubiquinone/menaquinone biosynthesis C-methylase UbiE